MSPPSLSETARSTSGRTEGCSRRSALTPANQALEWTRHTAARRSASSVMQNRPPIKRAALAHGEQLAVTGFLTKSDHAECREPCGNEDVLFPQHPVHRRSHG